MLSLLLLLRLPLAANGPASKQVVVAQGFAALQFILEEKLLGSFRMQVGVAGPCRAAAACRAHGVKIILCLRPHHCVRCAVRWLSLPRLHPVHGCPTPGAGL